MSKIVKKKDLDVLIESTLRLVNEDNYIKFKNNPGPWYDLDDYPYSEEDLPEDDYEETEYETYDEFHRDYPKHKHFMGVKDVEGSRKLFDKYKSNFGPLSVKRRMNKGMQESKSSEKDLINEDIQKELSNFNKLVNYTPKK